MNNFNLSKSDKKLVRELMDTGLKSEFRDFKHKVKSWVNDKTNTQTDKDWFWELHEMLDKFRKHMRSRYDGYGGSEYPLKMLDLHMHDMIPEEALARFSPDFQEWLTNAKKLVIQKPAENTP